MTRKSVWANADGLRVGFGPNVADYSSQGVQKQHDGEVVVRFTLDGEKFSGGTYQFDVQEVVPVGAVPLYCHVRVWEAFVLGGTTPTIQIGDAGSATRFAALSEANAEALGTYTTSVTATPLTAAGTIAVLLGGTTPTVTSAGKASVTLAYRVNAAV
jgi:hypothetical protein